MKSVQYNVVLLFYKKIKSCLYFSDFREKEHFVICLEKKMLHALCTTRFNGKVLAYFID